MSYNNFKAKIWSKEIQRELKRDTVFMADCVTKYNGEIKNLGDTVVIPGVGKPTITVLGNRDKVDNLTPETVSDTSVQLAVNKQALFCYEVGDVDKEQGAGGVLSILNTEASEELANEIDKEIANISKERSAVKLMNSGSAWSITKSNVHEVLDLAQQMLWENDVPQSSLITVTMPPAMYMKVRQANIAVDQNNSELLKNGEVGKYGNMVIRVSNNCAKDASGNWLVQVKTQRAIACASSPSHIEPFRPEKGFADAVKGFELFGTKLIRPKELVNIVCTIA